MTSLQLQCHFVAGGGNQNTLYAWVVVHYLLEVCVFLLWLCIFSTHGWIESQKINRETFSNQAPLFSHPICFPLLFLFLLLLAASRLEAVAVVEVEEESNLEAALLFSSLYSSQHNNQLVVERKWHLRSRVCRTIYCISRLLLLLLTSQATGCSASCSHAWLVSISKKLDMSCLLSYIFFSSKNRRYIFFTTWQGDCDWLPDCWWCLCARGLWR